MRVSKHWFVILYMEKSCLYTRFDRFDVRIHREFDLTVSFHDRTVRWSFVLAAVERVVCYQQTEIDRQSNEFYYANEVHAEENA